MAQITVRYFASARAASGVADESVSAGTVAEVLDDITARHGQQLAKILGASSLLLDGVAVHDLETVLTPASLLDILPPFAGG